MALNEDRLVSDVGERLAAVKERVAAVCRRTGRPVDAVRVIAVAKGHPAAFVRAAYRAGHRDFGENYMQELVSKASELSDLEGIRWRFIGHLQRNKARDAVRICRSVDTVDSARLAEALDRRARQSNRSLEVMIEVNLGFENQKAGCAVGEVELLAASIRRLDALQLCGLMAIPPVEEDPEQSRSWFRRLKELRDRLGLPELSMGMSDDMEAAVEEGATMVRVGTAIFGPRPPSR